MISLEYNPDSRTRSATPVAKQQGLPTRTLALSMANPNDYDGKTSLMEGKHAVRFESGEVFPSRSAIKIQETLSLTIW